MAALPRSGLAATPRSGRPECVSHICVITGYGVVENQLSARDLLPIVNVEPRSAAALAAARRAAISETARANRCKAHPNFHPDHAAEQFDQWAHCVIAR